MKKIISFLVLLALIPVAFMAGCGKSSSPTSNPDTPTSTLTSTGTVVVIATATRTATVTQTETTTGTLVPNTSTYTSTNTASSTVTNTSTTTTTPPPTSTSTSTQTATNTQTVTVTNTVTNTSTSTASSTATNTMTVTQTPQTAQAAVDMNSAANFAVLASTGITSTGTTNTTVCGNMGISPGSSVTGAVVYSCSGGLITGSTAATAQNDLTTAYNDAAGRPNGAAISGDLGGLTIYPGLYKTSGAIGVTGDLTLDAQGNTNAIFIFQIGTTLTTASSGNIILSNGATAANIFWQVGSSCSLGSGSTFVGTIMAHTLIAFGTGTTLTGRALSETDEVTMISNAITNP